MSKAFTRESDDAPDELISRPPRAPLPPGTKNYLTSQGADRLRQELDHLRERRVVLAASPETDLKRSKLRQLEARIQTLDESLQTAVVVGSVDTDQVRFGTTVVVRSRSGEESSYRIVGVDETDIDQGWVSWLSPIAKALLNARVGDRVRFRFPSGEEELEVLSIT
jgi:transcription elongation factor GreB